MGRFYFVSQRQLDEWLGHGNADLSGETLSLRLDRQYLARMLPALYFTRIVSSPEDGRELTGKAVPLEKVQGMGAEVMQGSAVIGDDAYDVEEGFILREVVPPKSDVRPAAKPEGEDKEKQGVAAPGEPELDLLASFILQRMREDGKK
ncbi:MAG: hypothetical protein HY897_09660 [Deltaproteobacteria bacterium]|nr:hypothetical protein [Deltaproteobacteria bacterium]